MRYIMVAFWSVLIGIAVSYVLSSMANDPFNLTHSLILSAILTIMVILLADLGLKEQDGS